MQTHVQRFSDNKGAVVITETPSIVPTIRMLSGLPDVVLTHVHGPPGEGGACSTACDTGSAGSERHGTQGDAIDVIEREKEREREKRDEKERDVKERKNKEKESFFLSDTMFHLPRDDVTAGLSLDVVARLARFLGTNLEDDREREGESVWATTLIDETRVATVF